MSTRRGDWIQSWGINQIWPLDLQPEDVRPIEVGNATAKLCRFSGHIREHYSVAQHCVLVSVEVERRARAMGLHEKDVLNLARWGHAHDWTEGLGLVDVARPIKRLPELEGYRKIEAAMMGVVAERLGLVGLEEPPIVKEVDAVLCYTEARDLFPRVHPEWKWHAAPLPEKIVPLEWRDALALFRARFEELWPEEKWS
jgi:hypothetical protein